MAAALALGPVLPIEVFAQEAEVTLGTEAAVGADPGSEVSLPVEVTRTDAGAVPLEGLELTLSWDPALFSFVSSEAGGTGTVETDEARTGEGLLGISATELSGAPADFPVGTVTLVAEEDEGSAPATPVVTAAEDADGASLLTQVAERSVTLCVTVAGIFGDVNADGAVNVLDAQQIARFAVGLEVPDPSGVQNFGDVNADGSVNVLDAQLVARFAVGLEAPGRVGETVAGGECEPATDDPTAPEEDVQLSGEVTGASFTLPAGVTATAAGDLVIDVAGPVKIAGTLAGDCVQVDVEAGGRLVATGTVEVTCGTVPEAGAPTLKLAGAGGYALEGGGITYAGDLLIADDPEATFPEPEEEGAAGSRVPGAASARTAASTPSRGGRGFPAANQEEDEVVEKCVLNREDIVPDRTAPPPKAAGGVFAEDGEDGSDVTIECLKDKRSLQFLGGVTVLTQDGGDGGDGENGGAELLRPVGAFFIEDEGAKGGRGGHGGGVFLKARRVLFLRDNGFHLGDAGDGGDAIAVGSQLSPPDQQAFGAIAEAGRGGVGGQIIGDFPLRPETPATVGRGTLRIWFGAGASGGRALAVGAKGKNADADHAAQRGGRAQSTGGRGGDPGGFKHLSISFEGGGEIRARTGPPGDGGPAEARAGNGGNGSEENTHGARGGQVRAVSEESGVVGGNGGRAVGPGVLPFLVEEEEPPSPGRGGNAVFVRGNGGEGFNGCEASPFQPGGDGGPGGTFEGRPGKGGLDTRTDDPDDRGEPGEVIVKRAGNGGDAGDGEPPGDPGVIGTDDIVAPGKRTDQEPTFEPGDPAEDCEIQVSQGVFPAPGAIEQPFRFAALGPEFLASSASGSSASLADLSSEVTLLTLVGEEAGVVFDPLDREALLERSFPFFGVGMAGARDGGSDAEALVAYGIDGLALFSTSGGSSSLSEDPVESLETDVQDAQPAGGGLPSPEVVFAGKEAGVGFIRFDPELDRFAITSDGIPDDAFFGEAIAAYVDEPGGPVVFFSFSQDSRVFFDPRDGSGPTLVADGFGIAGGMRCLPPLCVIFPETDVTTVPVLLFDGASAPTRGPEVEVGFRAIEGTLRKTGSGNVAALLVGRQDFDDVAAEVEIAPDGSRVNLFPIEIPLECRGATGPIYVPDEAGVAVLITCVDSDNYFVTRSQIDFGG